MKSIICQSQSSAITQALGSRVAQVLPQGGVLLLAGELGSGKTTFVQGLAQGLTITTTITSPTFVILNSYPIINHPILHRLVHVDLYRISNINQLATLDLNTYQSDPQVLLVIEWFERNEDGWKNVLGKINFETGELNHRRITISGQLVHWLRR